MTEETEMCNDNEKFEEWRQKTFRKKRNNNPPPEDGESWQEYEYRLKRLDEKRKVENI